MDATQNTPLAGLSPAAWLKKLDELTEEDGHFEPLGKGHSAAFLDRGPVLLVTFEMVDAARSRATGQPMGWDLAQGTDWSVLTVLTARQDWFRSPRVYAYFDRLIDDGFFEDFDRVVFCGAGMCGYAAAAFSVAAPGATVLAVQPQATLDPRVTGWDERFAEFRRLCFTDRYGYAPHMIEAADRAFLFFDPLVQDDAIHASYFIGDNVHPVRMRFFGDGIMSDLERTGLLSDLVAAAISEAGLRPADVWRLLRLRKRYMPYLRNLTGQLNMRGRKWLLALTTREISARFPGRFAKAADAARDDLAAAGGTLPPRRGKRASKPTEAAL